MDTLMDLITLRVRNFTVLECASKMGIFVLDLASSRDRLFFTKKQYFNFINGLGRKN